MARIRAVLEELNERQLHIVYRWLLQFPGNAGTGRIT